MTDGDIANFIAAFSGTAAAIAAVVTIALSARQRSDERMVGYATQTLERAYGALVGKESTDGKAVCDRLAWLTSARLIQQYKDTKSRIKSSVVLHECEGHEEHWRHQFFLALTHLENISPEYYSVGTGKGPIADISAIIVHAFASWPDGKSDPLDVYNNAGDAVRSLGVNRWWITLRRHLNLL